MIRSSAKCFVGLSSKSIQTSRLLLYSPSRAASLLSTNSSPMSSSHHQATKSTTTAMTVVTPPSYMSRRYYRGDSGDAVTVLSDDEEALLRIAKPKADKMYEDYIQLPKEEEDEETLDGNNNNQAVRRKRLIYRSKQRGWLEVDLLLGTWANENVPHLTDEELNQFEDFVNMETIDIYNVITLRTDIPIEMQNVGNGGHIVEKIQEWCKTSPLGKADIEEYKKVKAEKNLI